MWNVPSFGKFKVYLFSFIPASSWSGWKLKLVTMQSKTFLFVFQKEWTIPANMRHWPNAGLIMAHHLRRWANIGPALGQCFVFAGIPLCYYLTVCSYQISHYKLFLDGMIFQLFCVCLSDTALGIQTEMLWLIWRLHRRLHGIPAMESCWWDPDVM